jgi:hypothetical protein
MTNPVGIIRYVLPGTLPGRDWLSLFDKGANLLIVDRDHFERLSDEIGRSFFVLKSQRFRSKIQQTSRHALYGSGRCSCFLLPERLLQRFTKVT